MNSNRNKFIRKRRIRQEQYAIMVFTVVLGLAIAVFNFHTEQPSKPKQERVK